jgi:hypothetical protein
LYSSSRLTFSGCITSSPLRLPPRERPPGDRGAQRAATDTHPPCERTPAAEGAAHAAAEQVFEDVKGVPAAGKAAAAARALLERLLAVLVVDLPLLGVRQHLVGGGYLLELQ